MSGLKDKSCLCCARQAGQQPAEHPPSTPSPERRRVSLEEEYHIQRQPRWPAWRPANSIAPARYAEHRARRSMAAASTAGTADAATASGAIVRRRNRPRIFAGPRRRGGGKMARMDWLLAAPARDLVPSCVPGRRPGAGPAARRRHHPARAARRRRARPAAAGDRGARRQSAARRHRSRPWRPRSRRRLALRRPAARRTSPSPSPSPSATRSPPPAGCASR